MLLGLSDALESVGFKYLSLDSDSEKWIDKSINLSDFLPDSYYYIPLT